ncbi:hypothetical protein [Paenibacillus sp. N3.4]|uniref:hypothetical protein n=1 Tax=Paenibacillus sp. N3.4 TaxID=2603222 RepID=UPI0011C8BAEE|nr:hypothetical protein [Paenibacillus sp. N3.4]TXK84602.1 hypothetical protein FU659_08255 [Paenibacillus sp. N3.4]
MKHKLKQKQNQRITRITEKTLVVSQTLSFTINIPTAGTYTVLFGSKKSNTNRTSMQLTVDTVSNVVGSVDETVANSNVQGMYLTNVGNTTLTQGSHTFTFTVSAIANGPSFDFIGLTKIN